MFQQSPPWRLIDLAERDSLKPARPFQPKAEAAYATEKVENAELAHSVLRCRDFRGHLLSVPRESLPVGQPLARYGKPRPGGQEAP